MRREASVLHLDLDAFYASVEQRDKPSLRGKPVVVGGVGQRGVVATASYEARVFGVRSAMPAHEARRRCPNAAFLVPRFDVYKEASAQVMGLLRALSPLVEPLSLDEAFVDLRAAPEPVDLTPAGLDAPAAGGSRTTCTAVTGGLTASVGAASSKFLAKIASELEKPDGLSVVEPGTEVERIGPMGVGVIFGVGPVTRERLDRIGVRTVADLRQVEPAELAQVVGQGARRDPGRAGLGARRPARRGRARGEVDLDRGHLRHRREGPGRAGRDPAPPRPPGGLAARRPRSSSPGR